MGATKRFDSPTWYESTGLGPTYCPPVTGRIDTEFLIIGAGLAGLGTALELVEKGQHNVVVVDCAQTGAGASGRNGGFVFAGFSLDNEALLRQAGPEAARTLHGWTQTSVHKIRSRCIALGVDIDERGVLLADWFGRNRELARLQCRFDEAFGFNLQWIAPERMGDWVRSSRYGGGLLEPGAFHFNPLAYCGRIVDALTAAGARVAGASPVTALTRRSGGWTARTPHAEIHANHVVLASGGDGPRLVSRAFNSVHPIATYIMVTEPLGSRIDQLVPGGAAVYDTRFAFDYYRPLPDQRLLWGGRISTAARDPAAIRSLLYRDMLKVFPSLEGCRIDYAWGGWMGYARHQMPVLSQIEPGLWTALGFGGHGMATTSLAGEVIAEALLGDRTRLDAFGQWGPVSAGGLAGRAAVQGVYWWKQFKDRLTERKTNRSGNG